MGLTGKKRSREHSRNAESTWGSAHRLPIAGSVGKHNTAAGKIRLKHQHATHALSSQPHAKPGKAVHKGRREDSSGVRQPGAPQQERGTSHSSRPAAPVMTAADGTPQFSAAADCALPQRKHRNKNKFKPDPEPDMSLAPPQHANAEIPSMGRLPLAADRKATTYGRPPQESGVAAGTGKKRSKKKSKQANKIVTAPAQPLNIPGAKQHNQKQSGVSLSASIGKPHGQDTMPAKTALNTTTQSQPAALKLQKLETAGARALRQGNAPTVHAEQSDVIHGSHEHNNHRNRHKADGHAQKSKAPEIAPVQQQAPPRKAGKGSGPRATAAAKVAMQTTTAPPLPGVSMSANWAALKAQIAPSGTRMRPRKAAEPEDTAKAPEAIAATQGVTPVLAVDCEMVGAGPEGARSLLARVCVVNQAGNVLLDEYVAQKERVTDYRTRFSGIRPSNLVGAPSLEEVQAKVAAMFKGRIVVGHSITNDLTALLLSHPRKLIRDTARFPPLMRAAAPGRRPKPRALRHLAAQHLGLTIQAGEHSPVDDARAALYLYLRFKKEWEHNIERGTISQLLPPLPGQNGKAKRQRTFEEMAAADTMVDL